MRNCSLSELLEQVELSDIRCPPSLAESSVMFDALDLTERHGMNAMCFYLGDESDLRGFRFIPELVRPPYPVAWFEFDHLGDRGTNRFGVLAIEQGEETVWIVFCRPAKDDYWTIRGWACIAERGAEELKWQISPKAIGETESNAALVVLHCVSAFLSAINCSNVRRIEHAPPEKMQKARAKRGKKPLFSFWTLELDTERRNEDGHVGGTHASPRLHLRRGHARQYAKGKWCWVQPCVVGNKAAGIVHKDYSIRTQVSNVEVTGLAPLLAQGPCGPQG